MALVSVINMTITNIISFETDTKANWDMSFDYAQHMFRLGDKKTHFNYAVFAKCLIWIWSRFWVENGVDPENFFQS